MKIIPTELTKLREHFDVNGVSYEEANWKDNWYNLHVDLEYINLSFLTSEFSHGGIQGLIEFYNFRDEPTGYLTADEAIEIYEGSAKEIKYQLEIMRKDLLWISFGEEIAEEVIKLLEEEE